jgi:hypothetical protein
MSYTGQGVSAELQAILAPLIFQYKATIDGDGGGKHTPSQVDQTLKIVVNERIDFKADLRKALEANSNAKYIDEKAASSYGSIGTVRFDIFFENGTPQGSRYRVFFKQAQGSGRGADAKITALGESMQAYMLACRQGLPKAIKDISDVKYFKNDFVKQFSDCDRTHNDCMDNCSESWMESAVSIANFCYGREKLMLLKGTKKYEFHRGSEFTKKIYECLKVTRKNTKININDDKWNPADIWAVSTTLDRSKYNRGKFVDKFIADLNAVILEDMRNGDLFGISLKKVENTTPTSTMVNDPAASAADIHFARFSGTDAKHTQFVYLHFSYNGKLGQLKFRKAGTGHQGEIDRIQGSTSAAFHGKVGIYQDFVVKMLSDNLPGFQTTTNIEAGKFIMKSNADEIGSIIANAGKSNVNFEKLGIIQSNIEMFLGHFGVNVDGEKWVSQHSTIQGQSGYSKYLGLQVAYYIDQLNVDKKNELTAQLTSYAMSQVPGLSCPHIKIQ